MANFLLNFPLSSQMIAWFCSRMYPFLHSTKIFSPATYVSFGIGFAFFGGW